ncbi:Cad superfamily protein [Streptococcus pneumoniae]|nr:Cad superfamily protein [Streptococcus pneumoniae]
MVFRLGVNNWGLIFETIEKYERIIVPLVFILLGLYIMYENGTIETFLIV